MRATGTVILSCLFIGVWGCGRNASELIPRGEAQLAEGKLAAARLTFEKAVQADARNSAAYWGLGRVAAAESQPHKAAVMFEKVLQLAPQHVGAQEELLKIAFALYSLDTERSEGTRSRIEKLGESLRKADPANRQLKRMEILLAILDGRFVEADRALKEQLKVLPKDREYRFLSAQTDYALDREKQAIEALEKLVAEAPEEQTPYSTLYRYYRKANEKEKATELLRRRAGLKSTQVVHLLQLAAHYGSLGLLSERDKVLVDLQGQTSRYPLAKLHVADFWAGAGDPDKARGLYGEISSVAGEGRGLAFSRLMNMDLAKGNWQEALATLKKAREALPDDKEILLYEALGQSQAGTLTDLRKFQKTLDEVDVRRLNDPLTGVGVARAYLRLGQIEKAKRALAQVVELMPGATPAHLLLVQMDLVAGRGEEALRRLDQATAPLGALPEVIQMRAAALRQLRRGKEARALLQTAMKANPDNVYLQLEDAALRAEEGDMNSAEQRLLKLMPFRETRLAALTELGRLMLSQRRAADLVKLCEKSMREDPDNLPMVARGIQFIIDADQTVKAKEWAEQYVGRFPESPTFPFLLAAAHRKTGDAEAEARMLQRVMQLEPDNRTALILLANRAQHQGRTSEAIRLYRQALVLEPKEHAVLNNLAWLLSLEQKTLSEAEKVAAEAVRLAPQEAEYADTLGSIYMRQGRQREAVQALRNAVHRQSQNAGFHYHLGQALEQAGDKAQAETEYATALRLGLAGEERKVLESRQKK